MPYPSINFNTVKRDVVPSSLPWRDKIVFIGEFSKGPTEVIDVTGKNFELYFGSDSTEGSVNVQQALELGATNISVSRAVPEDTPSTSSIYLASGNPTVIEPKVGYSVGPSDFNPTIDEADYTTGLSVELSYVGSPIINRTLLGKVSTKDVEFDHPDFDGKDELGEVIFGVVDFKAGAATPAVKHDAGADISVKTVAGAAGVKQVVAISKTDGAGNDINLVDQSIQPGYVLTDDTVELLILTKPFSLSATHWGVLVENLTITTATTLTAVTVKDHVKDVYILGYKTNLTQAGVVTPRTAASSYYSLPVTDFDNGYVIEQYDSFFALEADQGGVDIEFKYDIILDSVTNTADAYALGAEGFSATSTKGIQLLFGEEGDTATPIPLLVNGQFSVLFAKGYALAGDTEVSDTALTVGTSGKAVMNALYNAINGSLAFTSLLENITFVNTYFPYGLVFDTAIRGIESSRIKYKVAKYISDVTDTTDIYLAVDGAAYDNTPADAYVALTGGYNGPTYAQRDFFSLDGTALVRVAAISPGVSNLKVTLAPVESSSIVKNVFTLSTTGSYNNKPFTETLRLDASNVNPDNGLFNQSLVSAFVRVYYIPYVDYSSTLISEAKAAELLSLQPLRSSAALGLKSANYGGVYAPEQYGASVLKDLPLLGGSDYLQTTPPLSQREIRKRSYIDAIKRVAGVDAAFVAITGISYGDPFYAEVFEEAIDQIKNSDVENGLRQLFLQTPANMPGKRAQALSDAINNRYVTLVNGRTVQRLESGQFFNQGAALGYYVGLLATRPPHISVHAPYRGVRLNSIQSSDVKPTKQFKTDITTGRVDTIYFDNGMQTWKFLNGLTTSSVVADRYVSVNRIRIQIISDLYNNLQWLRSLPSTPEIQSQVETAAQAYMTSKMQEGWLLRLGDIVCNSTNNSSSDVARGIINLSISYLPVIPADFINVDLIEDYTLVDTISFVTTG